MTRKPIFDRVRAMLGRGFTQSEVRALDAAISAAEAQVQPDPPSAPEQPFTPAQTGPEGIALIQSFERFKPKAYPDPGTGGKPWTIGWGATTDEQGKPIQPGAVWTQERADKRFAQHLGQFEREVIAALGSAIHATSQQQFDALVSFQFNTGALARSTLLRKHKAGDYAGAAAEFGRWIRAGGKVLPGLVRRRAAEAALYREGSK